MSHIQATIEANYEIFNYLKTNYKDNIFEYTNIIGAGGDNSLGIDIIAEEIFVKHLGGYGKIVSEESGEIVSDNMLYSDVDIIIDPIDGSNNLMANIPYYGTSVAFAREGRVFASVVCNLANGDIFTKQDIPLKANLNKLYFKELIPKKSPKIGLFERAYTSPQIVKKLHDNSIKFRSLGAMALSLTLAYNLDFVIGSGSIREYDVAGGLHICEGLNIYRGDDILIVSKDNDVFANLKRILL
jgi:myo-inositol-1(or 4)-monophosphatase